jgi:hypothetical protein
LIRVGGGVCVESMRGSGLQATPVHVRRYEWEAFHGKYNDCWLLGGHMPYGIEQVLDMATNGESQDSLGDSRI